MAKISLIFSSSAEKLSSCKREVRLHESGFQSNFEDFRRDSKSKIRIEVQGNLFSGYMNTSLTLNNCVHINPAVLTLSDSPSSAVSRSTQRWTRESLAARAGEHQAVSSLQRERNTRAPPSRTAGPEWTSKTASSSVNRLDTAYRSDTTHVIRLSSLKTSHLVAKLVCRLCDV